MCKLVHGRCISIEANVIDVIHGYNLTPRTTNLVWVQLVDISNKKESERNIALFWFACCTAPEPHGQSQKQRQRQNARVAHNVLAY